MASRSHSLRLLPPPSLLLSLLLLLTLIPLSPLSPSLVSAQEDPLLHPPSPLFPPLNASENGTAADGEVLKEGSLAEIIDRVLENEFPDKDPNAVEEGSSFNTSVAEQQAVLETVARITHDKPRPLNSSSNETKQEEKSETGAQEVPILIDSKDNMFVMMNPKLGNMVLQQDLRLITDLVIAIASAAIGGIAFACAGQPVLTGYLLAGSLVGPGGLDLISELVQVETLAQFGVLFLLFTLGMDFSASKLRAVRGVAIVGGLLEIVIFVWLCGLVALACSGSVTEGVFVGALLSMSSTAVVLKCLMEKGAVQSVHGQITVATLVLQDCTVGLLFALLPLLKRNTSVTRALSAIVREAAVLALFLAAAGLWGRYGMARVLQMLRRMSAQCSELYQLGVVAICLSVAWVSDWLQLSIELGAFVAGVMISATDHAEYTLQQVDPLRNLFGALFMVSIGMLMNPAFLWRHLDILFASVALVVCMKTAVVTAIVRCFGYSARTAVTVGVSLAQIGEFAFVLLSRASNLHLVQRKVYLLLLGTTALSLISTPLLFRFIPHIQRVGVALGWFRLEAEPSPLEAKAEEETDPALPHERWNTMLDTEPLRQWCHLRLSGWLEKP